MVERFAFHVDPRNAADDRDELAIQTLFRNRMRMLAPQVVLVAVRASSGGTVDRGPVGAVIRADVVVWQC